MSKLRWLIGLVVVGLALAACSSSGTGSSKTSSGAGANGGAGSGGPGIVAEAKAALERNYQGTDGPVPSSGPAAATNKSIWIITCGQAAIGCATLGNAAVAAAKAIGWKATLCDGKFSPPTYVQCVNSAIAAHADAIVPTIVDCPSISAPLKAAHRAGIKIFGLVSFDCDSAGAPNLFDATVHYHGASTLADFYGTLAKTMSDYVIAKTNGTGHVLVIGEKDDYTGRAIMLAHLAELHRCSTCRVYSLQFSLSDLGSGVLASKVSAALVQHPDVTAVVAGFDAAIDAGIGQAVSGAGHPIMLTGLEGFPANISLIKQGRQAAVAGISSQWIGWAAIDGLNRLFAGQPQVDEGVGWQTVDKDHNLPKTPDYDGNVDSGGQPKQDYKAIYRKSWGK